MLLNEEPRFSMLAILPKTGPRGLRTIWNGISMKESQGPKLFCFFVHDSGFWEDGPFRRTKSSKIK